MVGLFHPSWQLWHQDSEKALETWNTRDFSDSAAVYVCETTSILLLNLYPKGVDLFESFCTSRSKMKYHSKTSRRELRSTDHWSSRSSPILRSIHSHRWCNARISIRVFCSLDIFDQASKNQNKNIDFYNFCFPNNYYIFNIFFRKTKIMFFIIFVLYTNSNFHR